MSVRSSTALADRLLQAHRAGRPLVLPNVWDVASARTVQDAGFAAVATSSRAIAQVFGETDDDSSDPDLIFGFLARVAAAVDVPVTADLQAGLHLEPAELVDRMIRVGISGCNLEDSVHDGTGGLVDPGRQASYLAAVRRSADRRGVHLVLNARIDTFIRGVGGSTVERIDDVVTRARTYIEAGADCVYPMGHLDPDIIRTLVDAIDAPVNVMSTRDGPSVDELADIGIARISFGSGLYTALVDEHRSMLAALVENGTLPATTGDDRT